MRLAERVPLRGVIIASSLLAVATPLTCGEQEREIVIYSGPRVVVTRTQITFRGHESLRHLAVHAKTRHLGGVSTLAHAEVSPLFRHLPPDALDDRARWIQIDVGSDAEAETLVTQLAFDPEVEEAFIAPESSLPTSDPQFADDSCPVTTPSFESYQGYLGPAPHGIDAPAAWRRGLRGAGVWFADIEGAWNPAHEDLPGERIQHAGGELVRSPGWREHGTAVLGEVVGRDNGKGVVGIAPDVERVFTSSIGDTSVADAISTAADALRPGDVLLIELQSGGPRGRWVPVEFYDDVFDAIAAATKRGVVVIEAAGNGGESLDHSAYKRKFDRSRRDSGAIMVGAGGPPRDGFTDRERLNFSNYGGRVDVQGWGRMVATLDYGDLQACGGDGRDYTGLFSGTSSASPIVAGAAILLQSVATANGKRLGPLDIRRILADTGSPQVGGDRENIGPRPNLARALPAID
jgi:subtilisin family serine protease